MTSMLYPKALAVTAAAALALQPVAASAQQACLTEDEVSAIAIYSVPSLVQAVRTRCAGELSASGFMARRGESLTGRYVALQGTVWPRAKSGLLKLLAGGARQARPATPGAPGLGMLADLPDSAVRPLVDALIVQEASAKIEPTNCGRIERVAQAMAPIDPEVAGTLLGLLVGFAGSDRLPVCPVGRS
jgi:hypothetical protein